MARHAGGGASAVERFDHFRANRMGETDVRDDAAAEKRGDAAARAVEKLERQEHVQGLHVFPKRAHGADGNNPLDAQFLEAVNVGTVIDLGGREDMSATVARKKGDLAAFELAENIIVRGLPERRRNAHFPYSPNPGHFIQAAAANQADLRLRHVKSPLLVSP